MHRSRGNDLIADGERPVDYDEHAPTVDEDERVTAMTAADNMPHRPPFTVDDLIGFPNDGVRYELFDGSLLVSPSPMPIHQIVAMHLQVILYQVTPEGLVAISTPNLKVDEENLFIPDFAVLRAKAASANNLMFRPADVLLAVEIVSHSTRKRDRILKLGAYAEAGIPHYWRVEPEEGPTLYAYDLDDGDTYRLAQVAPAGKETELTRPFPITVDPVTWTYPGRP